MRADLRELHSPDIDDLTAWKPDDDKWAILVQLLVGPEGGAGEESFDVTVCSAEWLAERVQKASILDLRHHVAVAAFDYRAIEQYFRGRVAACSGATWPEVAAKVGRLGSWEFEDYRE